MRARFEMGTPSFIGRHNSLKAKTFMLLDQEHDTDRWYSSQQLHDILGVNLRSLRTALTKWTSWRRLRRRQRGFIYEYKLAASGKNWINTWRLFMPVDRYLAEINEWQARKKWKRYWHIPFTCAYNSNMKIIRPLKCTRCGYEWYPRTPQKPKYCANKKCRSPYWNRPKVKNSGPERKVSYD